MQKKNVTRLVVGPISTNCWIYPLDDKEAKYGNAAIVIDPGDEAGVIVNALKRLNLSPAYILLTHGHFDHIAAVPALAAAFASVKPQIAIHRLDAASLGPDAYAAHCASIKAAMGDSSFIDSFWPQDRRGFPSAGLLLEEGSVIGPLTVLSLPGHTPGSAGFWDREEGVLFSGDTLFNNGIGRTDLPGGSETQMSASLRRLFDMDGDTAVYPGHGRMTTIGQERFRNGFVVPNRA